MPYATPESRRSFLDFFRERLQDLESCDDVDLQGALSLGKTKIRMPAPVLPLQLSLGGELGHRLNLDPEVRLDDAGQFRRSGNYLLFDPAVYFSSISGFMRLSPGDSWILGHDDPLQALLLGYSELVGRRHLGIKLGPKGLMLKRKTSAHEACVAPLADSALVKRQIRWRRGKLERLARILAEPIAPLAASEALDLLRQVIHIMEREPYRTPTYDGRPGGLLELPDGPTPIFVGDLHARIDNLLVVLTQNAFLESLENGTAMLIIIGDAVHPDEPGQEDDMEMSMLMMDLILRLKVRFPTHVFYLRGNHDSFSEDLSKGGVPQGLVWEKALHDARGLKYRNAMDELYRLLPYVAMSSRFLVAHAGAPSIKCTRDDLINIRDEPRLAHQLINRRMRTPNRASGYTRGDVTGLRKRLGLRPDTPFIVGHTPLTPDETCWWDAGGIEHHHVLFGADPETIGVITRIGEQFVPLRYPVEPWLPVYNRLVQTGKWVARPSL
ncbi:MAG: metallophosphoesterase [Sphingobacteriia bacterium]|nr:metallophosphoesterase [Sphingobacteriia bacterium]NCC39606.1 metallophosphoesterase [Gammaproteobacteria bacterium]